MADLGIWTKNSMIAAKTGANVNATAITVAETDKYVLQIESYINMVTRKNWSDAYTTGLNADVGGLLELAGSNLCAIYAINYDMNGFGSTRQAETMMDVLRDGAMMALSLLKDKKVMDEMLNA